MANYATWNSKEKKMLRILKFYIVLKYYDNVCLMLQEQKAYPNTTKG